ncbi:kinesin-like protein KIN-14N [Tripterygium wilfordii]|uniref:kinesin-like protein KIN-14N n=1 Tax=Tripterygium wilfordii TaxID=458696 RepID=UPI0018F81CCD|nr:kinesin-like protein KIN-14N [Tripterygium wilfordii]XP_038689247.1 kinesin-like protein KIN-14N [Tripterygium wilfordii]XP_038689248.1 kinesin-like protein KIN-14N [Tripterygium wilfordii]XP_038689249.1 kinesin-like protein KIN-14N [Tripterygium wilfordii]XP_038689250.1 kinesin-like protein KIN-14N [Tripterygium wilfordii]
MVGPTHNGVVRRAFSVVNGGQDLLPNSNPPSNGGSEYGGIEFTREDVDALLSERMKYKNKYNYKERCDNMMDYIRRLRLCIRWFQELEGYYLFDVEKLRNELELTERRLAEMEVQLKNKDEELNMIIAELRNSLASLQEKLSKEESDKLVAMDALANEKEVRISMEKLQANLTEELGKAQGELQSANQRIASINDMYKLLQEYNSSLQVYNSKLQTDLDAAHETIRRGEKEKAAIVENLSNLRGQYHSLQDQFISSKDFLHETTRQKDALLNEVVSLRAELQQVRDDRDCQQSKAQALTTELANCKELATKSNELEARCLSQSNQLRTVQDQLEAAEKKLQMSDMSALEMRAEFEGQKQLLSELQSRLEDAEFKLIEGEKLRKKLHNTVLELKGNIRVFCRVRPLLPDDFSGAEGKIISYPLSTEARGRGIELLQNGQKHSFTFDKVFMPMATQEDVFVEISQLVQSALDGYKVCIFAYGQTGSGKTYTMMGKPGHSDQKGLIPRTLEQIFQTKQALLSQGWKYDMQVSMLEIYNETIRDLLTNRDSSRIENGTAGKQYAIKHDVDGNAQVSDLTVVDVCTKREVTSLLDRAAHSRSVGKTQMNEQSSRSHFVFTLRISGVNESTEQQVEGILNLIDLAGSERLSKSGSTGDRLKETQAINKSLSSLSDVIFALAKKEDFVPFRNSKLTYLLQPCLGGDSKTLMFVNISPEPSSMGESLCSLRFAARVNACEIGVPRRQMNVRTSYSRLSLG